MMSRTELETQLVNEIHYLPIDAIETLLKLTLLLKKQAPVNQANNFADFIRNSPLMDVEIDLSRNQSLCRDIEL
jgi:hypothetical protein